MGDWALLIDNSAEKLCSKARILCNITSMKTSSGKPSLSFICVPLK